MAEKIEYVRVGDLVPAWLNTIPENLWGNEVFIVQETARSETGAWVTYELNYRLVMKQLGLNIPSTDKRELFYTVRNNMGGTLDINGKSDQQYISFSDMVKRFCEKCADKLGYEYWGFVLEYLDCGSKDTVIVYDINLRANVLTENFTTYEKTAFFLIICEKKATLEAIMEGIKAKGYDSGFYGVVLGGYGITPVIKLLISLRDTMKFATFVAHDYDIDGLKIFFDLRRWIGAESIGINKEFLDYFGVDFETIAEDYDVKSAQTKGALTMVDEISDADENQKNIWKQWIVDVSDNKKRAELNALTAVRVRQDPNLNKARDFVNYLIEKLENNRIWDLNRYDKPSVNRPSFISKYINEIKDLASKPFDDYLRAKGLSWGGWTDLVDDLRDRFLRENSNYTGSLTKVRKVLRKQSIALKEALEETDEYKEVKIKMEKIRKEILAVLNPEE